MPSQLDLLFARGQARLLSTTDAALFCGLTVSSFYYHAARQSIKPVKYEKQYAHAKRPTAMYAVADLEGLKRTARTHKNPRRTLHVN